MAKAAQQISFEMTPLSESEFLLQAESSSGLPVSFQVEKGTALIRGDTLIAQASGGLEVGAYQYGNENYLPAEPIKRSVEVEIITSIGDEVSAEIKIYPNPTAEELFVVLSGKWRYSEYMLLDEKGALVEKARVSSAGIDMRSRSAGVYLLKVKQGKEWFSYKIVKK